jgi:flagellar biosynthetic protein FliQ
MPKLNGFWGNFSVGRCNAPQTETALTGLEVIDAASDAILTVVVVSAPLMVVGLLMGVGISLIQALTQIQEMTLVYVPKIVATFLALLVYLPFMAETMNNHKARMVAQIALQK